MERATNRTTMTERPYVPDSHDDGPHSTRPPSNPSSVPAPAGARPDGTRDRQASSRLEGGASVVLAARGLVAFELAQWPGSDPKELDLAVERLARQGQQLAVPIEALIVELKQLVDRHVGTRRPEHECRPMREHLVSMLIEAYYRSGR